MEGSPFALVVSSFHDLSPFSAGFGSPFGAAFPSSPFGTPSSPFPSSPSPTFNCVTTGRIRNRECFEAQQQEQLIVQQNVFQQQHCDERSWPSPIKKRKQNMEIDKPDSLGDPNTSTREKRKRWGKTDEMVDKPNKVDRTPKQRKLIHKKPDAKDIPKARLVHVRFGPDLTQTVEAKILYKEPWGVMVRISPSPFVPSIFIQNCLTFPIFYKGISS